MPRVLVADPIAAEGVELLGSGADVDVKHGLKPAELLEVISSYDALVVRSETKVTPEVVEAAKNLMVIARAGIGVDNINLEAATNAGIAVVNAPIGNTVAAAEHTVALMLALARNVPQAVQSVKQGEWRRSAFMGIEVRNKVLGVIGLGRVGSEVCRRAQSFGMRLVGFDPFVTPDHANRMGVELMPLADLLSNSDFITLHTPLTPTTTNLLSHDEFNLLKPGARLINVARGELIDENALLEALDSDRLSGVALDVFIKEPPDPDSQIINHPKVIATPHLGASTEEAQREVAIEAAEQVLNVLNGKPARNTVNGPVLSPEVHQILGPYIPVGVLLGKLLTNLAEGQFVGVTINYEGEIAEHDTMMLQSAVLEGLLSPTSSETVNLINAPMLAKQRGLNITEQKNTASQEYSSLITATLSTTGENITVSGTSLREEPHLVKVNDYWLDVIPSVPYLLFVDNPDHPGSIGAVGTVAGQNNINISFMEVGRLSPRGKAMMVLGLDDPIPQDVLAQINNLPQINDARLVKL